MSLALQRLRTAPGDLVVPSEPLLAPDGYHTHYAALAGALALVQAVECRAQAAPQPVFELGAGLWSTAMLDLMCQAQGRDLVTFEPDAAWAARFARLTRAGHAFVALPPTPDDWVATVRARAGTRGVGLVFVDQEPHAACAATVRALRAQTALFVMHDVEPEAEATYGVRALLDSFRFVWTCRAVRPHTAVFSDTIPLPFGAALTAP